MCPFDIKSLFTNVPLEEAIQICAKDLYHTDIPPPHLSEKSFLTLIRKVTTGVEFSFDNTIYRQIDGVAMGAPLGPVLANIFVGFHEESLNISSRQDILLYHRYVDDTFALENEEEITKNNRFLEELNRLHPALEFTCENEDGNKLPFMDVHVHKHATADGVNINFETTELRKATFTGVYTHWNSFTTHRYKTNLIRFLVNRVVKI